MTEAEWLACERLDPMLGLLRDSAGARKLRLFACGCCRRVGHLLTLPHFIRAVEISELFADDLASEEELRAAHGVIDEHLLAQTPEHGDSRFSDFAVAEAAENWPAHIVHPVESACRTAGSARKAMHRDEAFRQRLAAGPPEPVPQCHSKEAFAEYVRAVELRNDFELAEEDRLDAEEAARQVMFIRCIFGNPFRSVAFSPSWRTDTAVALARQMYESRDFSLMPILADALQDAGCDCLDILAHCRGPGPHVRGCCVADMVLGRD